MTALREVGAMVVYLDPEGGNGRGGLPDLLVSHRRCGVRLLEVKAAKGRINPAQEEWHARWLAAGGPAVVVVRSVEEALRACGLI